MAFKQNRNPFGKSPLNFNSPLNSFDSLVGKLMNQGKSKEAATKIAGKIANMKMKGAGSGPTAAQKARAKGSPAKQAKPDFLDLDKDGNTSEPMKEAAKSSPAKMHDADKVKKLKSEISILRNDPEKAVQMGLSTEGQGGVDYEAISQREDQIKAEQAKHDRKKESKESPAKMKSPIEKELVGKQKNLPEGLKKAIEAAPESPAKMKDEKSGKSHGEMSKKEAHNHRMVHHVAKKPDFKKQKRKKPSRPEASKRIADQLNAKDPIKASPGSPTNKVDDMTEAQYNKAKKISAKRRKAKGLEPIDIPYEKRGQKPAVKKAVKTAVTKEKAKAKAKADKAIKAKYPKGSPAKNKVEGLSHDQLAKKSSKGYKRHMEIHKSADKRIDPKKDGLTKLGRAAVRSAVAGAAAGGIKKKTSPLNNAYENPEFFTPTKSSYGQDMDNFFSSVEQGYQDAINPELQEQKARMREGRLQNRQERIDRRIDKNVEKGNFDKARKLADRSGKVGEKIVKAGNEANRFGGIVDELNRNKGFDLTSLSKDQIDFIKNNL